MYGALADSNGLLSSALLLREWYVRPLFFLGFRPRDRLGECMWGEDKVIGVNECRDGSAILEHQRESFFVRPWWFSAGMIRALVRWV